MEDLIIILIGFTAGLVGSMLGVGGGFLIVPLLCLLLYLPMHVAVGLSLSSIVATSIFSTITYSRKRMIDLRVGLTLEIITLMGAICGSHIALLLSDRVLKVIFGIALSYASIRMIFPSKGREGKRVSLPVALMISFMAGMASGMLGIGGGTIKVPLMVLLFNIPVKTAIATSAFMVGLTASTAAITYQLNGLVDPMYVVRIIIGIFAGVNVGCRLALKAKPMILRRAFGVILLTLALRMLLEGIM